MSSRPSGVWPMTECVADQREQVRAAAEHIAADPRVHAVNWLAPREGARDAWTLDVVCDDQGDATPLSVQRRLTTAAARIVETTPQSPDHRQVLAVLEGAA